MKNLTLFENIIEDILMFKFYIASKKKNVVKIKGFTFMQQITVIFQYLEKNKYHIIIKRKDLKCAYKH